MIIETVCKMRRKSYTSLMTKKHKSPSSPSMALVMDEEKKQKEITPDAPKLELYRDRRELKKALKLIHRMSNSELESLLDSEDDFIIDCLIERIPTVRKLHREYDELQQKVNDLANFNYAREPGLVRDRNMLRETLEDVSTLRQQVNNKCLKPILNKLTTALGSISLKTRSFEEQSETVAKQFLDGSKAYDVFIEDYIRLRKEASKRRILADKLAKERSLLAENITQPLEIDSPIPAPRQRKRISTNK